MTSHQRKKRRCATSIRICCSKGRDSVCVDAYCAVSQDAGGGNGVHQMFVYIYIFRVQTRIESNCHAHSHTHLLNVIIESVDFSQIVNCTKLLRLLAALCHNHHGRGITPPVLNAPLPHVCFPHLRPPLTGSCRGRCRHRTPQRCAQCSAACCPCPSSASTHAR